MNRRPAFILVAVSGALLGALAGVEAWFRRAEADAPMLLVDSGVKYLLRGGGEENQFGWRERDVPLEKAPGVFRIAVLGDSVTFGAGVEASLTWPRQLEAALVSSHRVEVLNFSVVGYDIESIESVYREKVAAWRPDLVLYGFFQNDTVPTELLVVGGHPVWVATGPRDFRVVSRALDPWLHPRTALFRYVEGAAAARAIAARPPGALEDWDYFARHAEALIRDTQEGGVPLVVYLIPPHTFSQPDLASCDASAGHGSGFCAGNDAILGRAASFWDAHGVRHVDGVAAYRADGPADLHLFPRDPHHPNALGHARLAAGIAATVQALLPP